MGFPRLSDLARHKAAATLKTLLLAGCFFIPALGLRADDTIADDLRQTVAARKLLDDDALLGPLDIGVRVQQRMAVLWGPVPSPAHAQRALKLLKQLPELRQVRDELWIDVQTGPQIAAKAKPADVVWQVMPEPKPRPEQLTRLEAKKVPDPLFVGPELPPVTTQALKVAQPPQGSDLEQLLATLQRVDPRCSRLRLEVRAGLVTISGHVNRWEDLNEIATLIARMSGVERVILQKVRSDSPS